MIYQMNRHRCSSSPSLFFSATQFPEAAETPQERKETKHRSWNRRRSSVRRSEKAIPKAAESDWRRRNWVRFGEMAVWSCGSQQRPRRLRPPRKLRWRRRQHRKSVTWRRMSGWECASGAEKTRRGSGKTPLFSSTLKFERSVKWAVMYL